MDKDRLEELLDICLDYLTELKENDYREDKEIFVKNTLGLNEEEIEYFGLDYFLAENNDIEDVTITDL